MGRGQKFPHKSNVHITGLLCVESYRQRTSDGDERSIFRALGDFACFASSQSSNPI